MSKEITKELIKLRLESIKNPLKKKKFLIDCLKKQGLIDYSIQEEILPFDSRIKSVCEICNSNDIIFTNHEAVCNTCGTSRRSLESNPYATFKQDLNFSKSSFIEPGTMKITVVKDGVQVIRDLAEVNKWLNLDPEEQRIKNNVDRVNEVLDSLSSNYNPQIFDKVREEIISFLYNIVKALPEIKGQVKKAMLVFAIYYPLVYNNLTINIQKLSTMFDITTGEVYKYNFILKDLFSGTSYEKYISLKIGTVMNLEMPDVMIPKFKRVKNDLKDYLSNPLKDKETAAIIYFLGNLMNMKTFTLTFISEKTGVSTNTISAEAYKIEKFYKKMPFLKKRLVI